MQGFNMGRYRPYDSDPREESFNARAGKHPLGDRARKLDQGVLIVRFELPFNIWCEGCGNHIGQGVRYNAEKKKVGNYLSTPIWSFRCKCHLCSSWFEIRTDPKNTRYAVESGAKQQNQEWDADALGSFSIELDKGEGSSSGKSAATDAFAILEKSNNDKRQAKRSSDRIAELEAHNERWADPYSLNAKLRKILRKEKRMAIQQDEADSKVRERIGWLDDAKLEKENEESRKAASEEWARGKAKMKDDMATSLLDRDKLAIELPTPQRIPSKSNRTARTPLSVHQRRARRSEPAVANKANKATSPAEKLAARLAAKARRKSDPFMKQVEAAISK